MYIVAWLYLVLLVVCIKLEVDGLFLIPLLLGFLFDISITLTAVDKLEKGCNKHE